MWIVRDTLSFRVVFPYLEEQLKAEGKVYCHETGQCFHIDVPEESWAPVYVPKDVSTDVSKKKR